jgi:hypothetical protein
MFLPIDQEMTPLPDDSSTRTLDEVFKSRAENRAWNKEIRLQSTALVNSRLAKAIGLDEYAANRKRLQEDAAECSRRTAALLNEISGQTLQQHEKLLCPFRQQFVHAKPA